MCPSAIGERKKRNLELRSPQSDSKNVDCVVVGGHKGCDGALLAAPPLHVVETRAS